MRTKLRIAAFFVALGVTAWWFFSGPNTKWTKNTVTTFVKDPVTGIEGPVEKKVFIPGIDFLGAGLLVAGGLVAGSFLFRGKAK